jgi:hypothetical protein
LNPTYHERRDETTESGSQKSGWDSLLPSACRNEVRSLNFVIPQVLSATGSRAISDRRVTKRIIVFRERPSFPYHVELECFLGSATHLLTIQGWGPETFNLIE